MPPDLERYHVVWWRPGWATAFDSVANENGQRGINIPTNCKYVQVRYGQIKSTLFARLDRAPPDWNDTEVYGECAFEVPGAWMSGALLASNEVESLDGVIGFCQNLSNSTFDLLAGPFDDSPEDTTAIGRLHSIKTLNFPSWANGSIYRLRDGYSKFRPYWLVPRSFNLFQFMVRLSNDDTGGRLPLSTPFEASTWGNFKPFDGHSYIHVLRNNEALAGGGGHFTNSLIDVAGYRCYQTLDYLVELRFYEEKEE